MGRLAKVQASARAASAGHPEGVALWRVAGLALVVLALLIALTAPAARGVAAAPGDRIRVTWLDVPDHALDAIVDVQEAPDGTLYAAGVTNDDWAAGADLLLLKGRPATAGSWPRQ